MADFNRLFFLLFWFIKREWDYRGISVVFCFWFLIFSICWDLEVDYFLSQGSKSSTARMPKPRHRYTFKYQYISWSPRPKPRTHLSARGRAWVTHMIKGQSRGLIFKTRDSPPITRPTQTRPQMEKHVLGFRRESQPTHQYFYKYINVWVSTFPQLKTRFP